MPPDLLPDHQQQQQQQQLQPWSTAAPPAPPPLPASTPNLAYSASSSAYMSPAPPQRAVDPLRPSTAPSYPHDLAGAVFRPQIDLQGAPSFHSHPAQHHHSLASGVTGMSPLSPVHSQAAGDPHLAWRDDQRRKSVRLDSGSSASIPGGSGSLVGSASNGQANDWAFSSETASRRASWAGHAAPTSYAPVLDSRPATQGGLPGYYSSAYLSGSQAAHNAAAQNGSAGGAGGGPTSWAASHFSSGYTPTVPSTSEDPRGEAAAAAAASYPPALPQAYQTHPAYLSNAAAYAPYNPGAATFPPSTSYGYSQQASSAPLFTSPFSASPPTVHSAYLQNPHSALYSVQPTAVLPPGTVFGSLPSASSYTPPSPVSATFPLDASTPYIPASTSTPPPAVLVAAAARQKLGKIDLTGHSKPDVSARRAPAVAASTRKAVELTYDCSNCHRKLGTLTLRGGAVEKPQIAGDDPAKYRGVFFCSSCAALPPPSSGSGGNGVPPPHPANMYAGEATYYDTLTAAVDQHLGIDPKTQDLRPPPAAPGKTRSGFTGLAAMAPGAKKRRSSVVDAAEGVLACDVCKRDLGSGTLSVLSTGEPVGATIEVLCAHCETRYMRCSDCGGGGGQKGVGRWRCKEVFTNGRKTCMQSHTRLGTVNEMDYDVYPISSLSSTDASELVEHCRDLYYNTLLGTLAVPDMIESVCPIARSYAEVEKICVDSWTTYEPMITTDIEPTSNTRRYIALRWVRPSTRKKRSKKSGSTSASTSTGGTNGTGSPELGETSPEGQNAPLPPAGATTDSPAPMQGGSRQPVIREGKMLTGFILAEHDLLSGTLHIGITLPTGAGEAYEASTRLMQTLIARVHEDLAATNAHRAGMGLQAHPLVTMAWTMHMTKRDSRIMSRLETRRGFIPLEDYLLKYPETPRSNFPPTRSSYLPPELLRGWTVFAKRLTRDDLPPNLAAAGSGGGTTMQAVLAQRPSTSAGHSYGQGGGGAGQGDGSFAQPTRRASIR
ncbi:hypothetical protein JCM8097_000471 [Rhodosporidiobolus ruineniae]